MHTTASDGRLSPTEAVHAANERGLSAIAITDHDVLSGLDEAFAAAASMSLEIVPGIEMTAAWEGPRAPAEAAHEESISSKGWYTRGYLPHYDKPGTI